MIGEDSYWPDLVLCDSSNAEAVQFNRVLASASRHINSELFRKEN